MTDLNEAPEVKQEPRTITEEDALFLKRYDLPESALETKSTFPKDD